MAGRMAVFSDPAEVVEALEAVGYLADEDIATSVFLASALEMPLMVEGPAGVGKTELARALAKAEGRELIRLQCYEGLDETKALYEWAYAKQLLYTQVLRDQVNELLAGSEGLDEAIERVAGLDDIFFSERFLLPRPLLQALRSERPAVLLIDEVDKAEPEFEAFLLELLSDFAVTLPELGRIEARHKPRVLLTSNAAREMSDALKRRCLHLHIDFPGPARELAILRAHLPELPEVLAAQIVAVLEGLRGLELKKLPSISESIDWARALLLLGAGALDEAVIGRTLDVILKYEGDIARARGHLAAAGLPPGARGEG